MKFTTAVSSLMLGGMAAAQEIESKPFNLEVLSSDKSINNQKLSACHSGAAIESLCLSGDKGAVFHHNTTKGETAPIKGTTAPGTLTWLLPTSPNPESEPMTFYNDPTTNVALPLFIPGYDQQPVAFNNLNLMNIIGFVDDTKNPPNYTEPTEHYNWFACKTYYSGYTYTNLAWVNGDSKNLKPQNPTCVKVDVRRVFTK